jgi:hypothetical protein
MNLDKELEKFHGKGPRFQKDDSFVNDHQREFHGHSSSTGSGSQHMRAKELHCP